MSNKIFSAPFFFLLTFCVVHLAAQTTPKSFIKSFNIDGITQVTLDLPGVVETKEYDGTVLKFQIDVSMPSGNNPTMIEQMSNVGRYNLSAKTEGKHLIIDAPNLQRQIKVKGVEIKENLHFIVLVPKGVGILLPTLATPETAQK